MRGLPVHAAAIVAALALLPSAPRVADAASGWGLSGFLGYQTYAMSDVNDELITPLNAELSGSGYSMDEISGGLGFGGGIRYRTPGSIVVGADFERLSGGSDISFPSGSFEITTPANAVTGTLTYYFPTWSRRVRFGLGAGLGVYWSAGDITLHDSFAGTTDSENLEGSGVGFHGVGAMDLTLSSAAHLEASVGYRVAKTSDVTIDGEKQTTADGEDATLDWSGLLTRLGLTYYFGAQ